MDRLQFPSKCLDLTVFWYALLCLNLTVTLFAIGFYWSPYQATCQATFSSKRWFNFPSCLLGPCFLMHFLDRMIACPGTLLQYQGYQLLVSFLCNHSSSIFCYFLFIWLTSYIYIYHKRSIYREKFLEDYVKVKRTKERNIVSALSACGKKWTRMSDSVSLYTT